MFTKKSAALFAFGALIVTLGLTNEAFAQGSTLVYNSARLDQTISLILRYIEGSFGALVMVAAGLGAIMSAAFGQYKAALALLVVAVGAFILRSFVLAFFDVSIPSVGGGGGGSGVNVNVGLSAGTSR